MSSYGLFRKTVPISKVDETTHEVYGIACSEAVDSDGESCDYRSQVPYYREWEQSALTTTGGKSRGNVRLQHNPQTIAGKVTAINYDDNARAIYLRSQPTPEAWNLIEQGYAAMYSQAGQYVKRWCANCGETIPSGNDCPRCMKSVIVKYCAKIAECSYVDRGSNPDAVFEFVRADGRTEMRKARRYEGRQDIDQKRHHRIWLVEHLHDAHDKCEECDVPEHVKAHIAKARDVAQEWLYGEYPDMAVHGSEQAHGNTPTKVLSPASCCVTSTAG